MANPWTFESDNAISEGFWRSFERGQDMARQRQVDQYNMQQDQVRNALAMEEYNLAKSAMERELAAQRDKEQRNALARNAFSQFTAPPPMIGGGPMRAGYGAQVPATPSREDMIRRAQEFVGTEYYEPAMKYIEQAFPKPEDPYKNIPGDLRARMMADNDPRIKAALEAEDARKAANAKASAPVIQNFTGQREGQTEFNKQLAKLGAEDYTKVVTDADNATQTLYSLQSQRAAMEDGFKTGALVPVGVAVNSYLQSAGVKADWLPDPTKAQVFTQGQMKMLLNTLQAQKGPQTEGDAQRASQTFANIKNTNEANLFILDYLEEIEQRKIDMADFVQRYQGADQDPQAYRKAKQEYMSWASKTPVVTSRKDKSGRNVPILYSEYRKRAIDKGYKPEQIDDMWREFVKGK